MIKVGQEFKKIGGNAIMKVTDVIGDGYNCYSDVEDYDERLILNIDKEFSYLWNIETLSFDMTKLKEEHKKHETLIAAMEECMLENIHSMTLDW